MPRIDEEGRPVRTSQWLIELEAPVDVAALLRPDEGLDGAEARAAEALNVLEGGPADRRFAGGTVVGDDGVIDASASSPGCTGTRTGIRSCRSASLRSRSGRGQKCRPATPGSEPQREQAPNGGDEAARVAQAAAALGVVAERFERYADKRWGRGWKILNANGRKRAFDEVAGFADDGEGFRAKVDAELDVFS
ncbi:MAG: hypothetical protein IPH51_19205 [Rubrivivax sp.]|nr:hypothetical protein [Rubrivivax sp.]